MIDITGITIYRLFIHRVGNKLRNEGVICSEAAQQLSLDDELMLINFLFGHSERLNAYTFTHSVDSELNSVYALAHAVTEAPENLDRISADIANHLYSVSNHPRVKAGNLYIGLFEGIQMGGQSHTVLGIFKSDTINDFIKVDVEDGKVSLRVEQGAAVTSLDKVALIFLAKFSKPEKVLAACARGEDAAFWNERFLQLQPIQSAKANTKACLDICRAYATRENGQADDPERILFLNRSLQYFENADRYDEGDFASVFTSESQETEFKQFKAEYADEDEEGLPEKFEIEKTVVRKERAKFEKNIKLDPNIEIRLRFKTQDEMAERVEHGFDEEKGLAFYKLYYSGEEEDKS
ncbi:MAG: nucleoid-associated protein [Candidatus Methylacidiphilales bacterium]|nr:nucleoid-associated protein [Candidatus Methylacidiphilales bacterium]